MTNSDPQPATVADLLTRVRAAYADFAAAIGRLSDDQLLALNAVGSWSVRDAIAHVGADERWMAGQLEAIHTNELPTALGCYGSDELAAPDIDLSTQDGRNAWQYERLRGLSLDEVRSLAAEGHARLLAAIERFQDGHLTEEFTIADLGTMGHIRPRKEGEQGWPLWQWLRGVTYHHYDDHATGIREAAS